MKQASSGGKKRSADAMLGSNSSSSTSSSSPPSSSSSSNSSNNATLDNSGDAATSTTDAQTAQFQPGGGASSPPQPTTQEGSNGGAAGVVVDDLEAKRRKDVLKDMEKIEREFADLKEKLFAKKIRDLQDECKAIMDGTHEGFLRRAQELEVKKNARVWLAQKWKEYQLQNIEHVFQFECIEAEEEYNYEKRALRDEMTNEILDKQKKLEEEKLTMSLRADANGDARAIKGRVLRNRRGGKDRDTAFGQPYSRHRTIQPPHINYTLSDDEILSDLSLMRKRELPPAERRRLCQEASEWMPSLPSEAKTAKLGA